VEENIGSAVEKETELVRREAVARGAV